VKQWMGPALQAGGKNTTRWAVLGLVMVLLVGGLFWALKPEQHLVAVQGMGTPLTFTTTAKDLAVALKDQGIEVTERDRISLPLTTSLAGMKELTVEIKKAVPATVVAEGTAIETTTAADTVADLLQELNLTLGPKDTVSTDLTASVVSGMTVKVVRRTEQVVVVQEEIPYEVVREDDRTIMVGETKELQAGENGIREIRKVVSYEDGVEVASEVVEENVVKSPVDQIVAIGTGGVVSRSGTNYRYSRELTMTATGYTAGKESNPNGNGYTYTGMKAEYGVVAVDPRVIPLYTRLYIEGYGPAIAADIGGAIKGMKIDLCFNDVQEALNWGRRPVTVYVLDE
jgi:3D (Asp-Asp-Asp) domain-containing protein